MKVILLAAGMGRRFGKKTKRLPKCLIPLNSQGDHLLSRYLNSFRALNLKRIVIVVGHEKDKIKKACRKNGAGLDIRFIFNRNYKKGSLVSLHAARGQMNEDVLVMDADVFFPTEALGRLLISAKKTAFLIDTRSKSSGEEMMLMAGRGAPIRISKRVDPKLKLLGEAVGFLKIQKKDALRLKKILESFVRRGETGVEYEESYNFLMRTSKLGFERIDDFFWTEMDFEADLQKIRTFQIPEYGA